MFLFRIKSLLCVLKRTVLFFLSCPFCKESLVKASINWHQICSLAQQRCNIPYRLVPQLLQCWWAAPLAVPRSLQSCQSWLAWARKPGRWASDGLQRKWELTSRGSEVHHSLKGQAGVPKYPLLLAESESRWNKHLLNGSSSRNLALLTSPHAYLDTCFCHF